MDDYLSALEESGLSEASGAYTCKLRVGGQDCILVSTRSNMFGLRYTTVLFGDMEKRLHSVTLGFIIMMLITLLFGVTLALLISRRNYQPIRRLRSKASELVEGEAGDKDDYNNIYHAMEDLGNQNMLMRSSVSDMQAYLTYKLQGRHEERRGEQSAAALFRHLGLRVDLPRVRDRLPSAARDARNEPPGALAPA